MEKLLQIITRPGRLGHFIAFLCGAAVTLSFAPFDFWPAGIIAVTGLIAGLSKVELKQGLWRSYCYGFGLFIGGASWVYVSIHEYGNAPVVLAAFFTLLFCLVLALFYMIPAYIHIRWSRALPLGSAIIFPLLYLFGEWLRSWFLTGFPWLYLGYGHLNTALAGWVPIGGVWAATLATTLTAGAIALMLQTQKNAAQQLYAIASLCLIWGGGYWLNSIEWVKPSGKTLSVAMIQPNIPQQLKWRPEQLQPTLKLLADDSAKVWGHDLVIWPEAAVPMLYQRAKPFLKTMSAQARQHNSTLITGIPYRRNITDNGKQRTIFHNSIVASGAEQSIYFKQRLVPFGEYVPLESVLRGVIDFFDMPMSNFRPGDSNQSLLITDQAKLLPLICYEVVYPDLSQRHAANSDLLLTVSNDAWFGASIGPLQHLQMAQMRALENGRWMLRATNNGVSAIIDHRGRIVQQSEQFQHQTLTGSVDIMQGTTPWARLGSAVQ
ncbi:Apolipoprotein N-acyltransferase [Sinobacterium norvegicum]|uniref:Apolipoprotein N-acyltransferase n=1 Tax=Sinobacterium norvegicum TaxID=1641715 RepID=A0ABM9AEK8_9GAMM|nr:apolipoprotein N-acyltransferase [Sinobacterium norvegicum]CAH0991635.1 Apolipoprotein N-acyltransferase [Sinobacterium norvegicum]